MKFARPKRTVGSSQGAVENFWFLTVSVACGGPSTGQKLHFRAKCLQILQKVTGFQIFSQKLSTLSTDLSTTCSLRKRGEKYVGGDAHIAPPSAMTDHPQRADVGIGPYGKCWMMGVGTPLRGVRTFPHPPWYDRLDCGSRRRAVVRCCIAQRYK